MAASTQFVFLFANSSMVTGLQAPRETHVTFFPMRFIPVILVSATVGCQRTEVRPDMKDNQTLQQPVRVLYKDVEQATWPTTRIGRFYLPGEAKGSLTKVQLLTPDGWTDCEFRLRPDGSAATLWFRVPVLERQLCIDNRERGETTVGVGELQWKVEANKTPQFAFSPPKKDAPLLWAGKEIGRFSKDDVSLVIDPSAKRSYRLRRIVYQTQLRNNAGFGGEESEPKDLGGFSAATFHRLPHQVDFFLMPASKEILTRQGEINARRFELLEVLSK